MARAGITFNLGQGGLGQPAQGLDYVRGVIFYGTAPGSFATTATQAVFSVQDAETKGITNDYSDETKPAATYVITTLGATGDTINFTVTEKNPNGETTDVDLGTYTKVSGDSTIDLLGAFLVTFINAGTYSHGYTASFSAGTDTLTITGREGLGISLNTGTPFAVTISGTIAGTLTQPASATVGVYSKKALWHYHISEFFRANPTGKLWVNFTASPTSTFAEITTLQNAADGECRQIGVYNTVARSAAQVASDLTAIQAQGVSLSSAYKWLTFVYAPNIAAITDLSTLVNGQSYSNYFCNVNIAQDGDAVGAQLYVNSGVSVTTIGNELGTSSAADVSQNIGEIGAFNVTDGTELATPAFSNGQLASALSSSLLDQLDGYRYTFLTTYTGYSGTFYSDEHTFVAQSSDYNSLSRNLTIQKAQRGTYTGLLPLVKSRLYLNTDGTLTDITIAQYDTAAAPNLIQMVRDGDLSPGMLNASGALVDNVIKIDPTQNVLSTNLVDVTLQLLPVGMARFIEVNIGFVANLNS